MSTIPFPYGTRKDTDARLPRSGFVPLSVPNVYDPDHQRRLIAELTRALGVMDMALRQMERRLRALEGDTP